MGREGGMVVLRRGAVVLREGVAIMGERGSSVERGRDNSLEERGGQ